MPKPQQRPQQKNTLDSYFSPKPQNQDEENTTLVNEAEQDQNSERQIRNKENQQTLSGTRTNQQTPLHEENQQTPSRTRARQQTPSRTRARQQTPSRTRARQQTPSGNRTNQQTPLRKENQQTPLREANQQTPSRTRARQQTPSGNRTNQQTPLREENQQTPLHEENQQTPSRTRARQQTPSRTRARQQTPSGNRTNQQTPLREENQQTPLREENQQTPLREENQQTQSGDRENQQTPSGKGEKNIALGYDKYEGFYQKDIKTEFVDPEENHSHDFNLKISGSEDMTNISCDRPQTVLEAIRSSQVYMNNVKCGDHIVLQIGEASEDTVIATHFPCSCLKDKELITLINQKEKVEELKDRSDQTVVLRDEYSVFYIETKGGLNTKTKQLFKNSGMKKFSKLCVYETKDMTVEDAIRNDGRFCDYLDNFKLADTSKNKTYVYCDEKIRRHDGKTFRICLKPKTINAEKKAEKIAHLKALAKPRVVSVGTALKKAQAKDSQDHVQQIYNELREQFPRLKEEMLKRFPNDTFEETLKKVDFGKAQQSFSDAHRLKKLLKFGNSVCKLIIGSTVEGTAFVLCNNYILTNAHLFDKFIHNDNWTLDVEINALFNHENPKPRNGSFDFPVKNTIIDLDKELDYALLELDLCGQDESKVPPGLLKHFSPKPKSGEACIIGHPGGQVKKLDATCIIEKEKRQEEITKHLDRFQDMITLMSVNEVIKKQGIEKIIMSDKVVSYHTFMYHGSSGSPVFDGECRVFALHGSGFVYGFPQNEESVIEIAHLVLDIFECLVTNLKDKGKNEHLIKIKTESKGNKKLEEILAKLEQEPMDTD